MHATSSYLRLLNIHISLPSCSERVVGVTAKQKRLVSVTFPQSLFYVHPPLILFSLLLYQEENKNSCVCPCGCEVVEGFCCGWFIFSCFSYLSTCAHRSLHTTFTWMSLWRKRANYLPLAGTRKAAFCFPLCLEFQSALMHGFTPDQPEV